MLNFNFEEIPTTLQSQYSASPNISALVSSFENILPNEDIELFYEKIFDIYTAQGVGLDIWGRILGIGRTISIQDNYSYFGFQNQGLSGFNQESFYEKYTTSTFNMPDDAYRHYLLLTKAFANISSADSMTLNYILSEIFPEKRAYVLTVGTMQIRYVFEFELSALEVSVFNLGLLTRGAGVGYEYYQIPLETTFGFDGSECNSFENGVFESYAIQLVD